MSGIPGSPPDLRSMPSGCAFYPRCPLAFAACSAVLPTLQSLMEEETGQQVACHLYDPRFHVKPPALSDLAHAYASLAGDSNRKNGV